MGHRALRLAFPAGALIVAVAIAVESAVPAYGARVTGAILRCEGIRLAPGESPYVEGTVQVLGGNITWQPDANRSDVLRDVLPSHAIAEQAVGFGDRYTFELPPGHYVLNVLHAPAGAYASQYVAVTLQPGDNRIVNIPNTCI